VVLVAVLVSCTGRTAPPPSGAPAATGSARAESAACWTAPPADGSEDISFADVTESSGLVGPLVGMFGHAAAWGDVNGDGWLDLFVGTFADRPVDEYRARGATGPSPDRLLLGGPDGFGLDERFPEVLGRTSGAAFADLDRDGDLDLVVARNVRASAAGAAPSDVFENRGGAFAAVADPGIPSDLAGRSIGVLDADGDGLVDLFIAEDRFAGGSSVLLRNLGGLTFEDATQASGLPTDVAGFGVGVSDLNGDGLTDLFVAGSNRLFMADGDGTFREADASVFRWTTYGGEDDVTGVAIDDVNRDGLPDIVLGQHYNSTVDMGRQVPVRLYVNEGTSGNDDPTFRDVTEESGLIGLPTKAPHVELADLDNDGWPDLLTTASTGDGSRPVVFRHLGLEDGVPRFAAPQDLGSPRYWVTGPTADVDRDGRLDVFLVEIEPSRPSTLLRNETASGNWLSVGVDPELGGGIGARVSVFRQGELGEPTALIGMRDIVASLGYTAGSPGVAHIGLGAATSVDVRIRLPNGRLIDLEGVAANQHIRVPGGCP
jgi:hypothetical protein